MVFCLSKHPPMPRLLGHHRNLNAPIFISSPLGYYLIFMLNQTRGTASLSFPQEGKPSCRGFQWRVVLLHSETEGSVFIVKIIGGHSWNWGSVWESAGCQPFTLLSTATSCTIHGPKALTLMPSNILYLQMKSYNYLSLN